MNTATPDQETIRAALALAVRAPSVHNSQPWRWRVGDRMVNLHTDATQRDMLISCGIALQHFTVALAALGWQSRAHRFPDPADPGHLAAVQIGGRGTTEPDIALAAAIPRRRTDRRAYSSWPVSAGDIALMAARAARGGVALRRVPSPGPFADLLAEAVREHSYASLACVPGGSAPPPVPVPPQQHGADARADAGVVVVLATATDEPVAQLRAGEATGVVLLTATALGLSTCPVTEPFEIESTRAAVRSLVLGDDGYPQVLLRIGWAPVNSDPLPATPRSPLDELAERLDGSRL